MTRSITYLRLWRLAGALAIAHVVLLFAGVAMEKTPVLGDKPSAVADALVRSDMTKTFAGGYVEFLAFLVFLAGALLLAQLVRGEGDTARWLASIVSGSAVAYVAITVAVGFAAGAAATYDGHHGAPLATVTAVNDVRNFAFFLSVGVLGAFTVAAAAAAQVTGVLPRAIAYTGYVVGAVCIVSVIGARNGAVDIATMLWMLWFVGLGVVAVRGPRPATVPARASAAATV